MMNIHLQKQPLPPIMAAIVHMDDHAAEHTAADPNIITKQVKAL